MRSPTSRTLQFFKKQGCSCRVVETYNQWARRRIDLWGADILVRQGRLLMAIQTTSDGHHADRVKKSKANPDIRNWLDCGVCFYVYSVGLKRSKKITKKGKRSKRMEERFRVTQLVLNGNDKVGVL